MTTVNLGPNGELYGPNKGQLPFHQSAAQFRLNLGAWGSGKTLAGCVEDLRMALRYPGSVGGVFRATFPALRDTTKKEYLGCIPAELVAREIRSEGREEIELVNGSRTVFRCLDDYRKLGSTQFDRILVDEVEEVGESAFMTLAFGRLRGRIGPRRMVCCTNPPDENHYLYKFFVEQGGPARDVFHFTTYDNAQHLPDGYIANLEKMSPQWQRKYLFGQWGIIAPGAGVFAADFQEAVHVQPLTPIKGHLVIRGWDFGFNHPACVWLQLDSRGTISVLRELLGKQEPLRQFAARVVAETKKWFPDCPVEDYCDVAGNQRNDRGPTSVQVLANDFGINAFSRRYGVHHTIEGLRWLLQQRQIRFAPACRWLIKGMGGGYYYDPKRPDEPAKDGTYDHFFDALRYAVIPQMQGAKGLFDGKPLPKSWMRAA